MAEPLRYCGALRDQQDQALPSGRKARYAKDLGCRVLDDHGGRHVDILGEFEVRALKSCPLCGGKLFDLVNARAERQASTVCGQCSWFIVWDF